MVHYNALAANQSRLLPARQKKSNESLKRKPNTFCFTLCSNWDMAKGSDACWFHGHWLSAWIFYWWPGTLKKKRVKNWWPEVLGKVCMSGHLRMHTKHDDICAPRTMTLEKPLYKQLEKMTHPANVSPHYFSSHSRACSRALSQSGPGSSIRGYT